jgi:hypothetical protein
MAPMTGATEAGGMGVACRDGERRADAEIGGGWGARARWRRYPGSRPTPHTACSSLAPTRVGRRKLPVGACRNGGDVGGGATKL